MQNNTVDGIVIKIAKFLLKFLSQTQKNIKGSITNPSINPAQKRFQKPA